jgi:hypothetical protein
VPFQPCHVAFTESESSLVFPLLRPVVHGSGAHSQEVASLLIPKRSSKPSPKKKKNESSVFTQNQGVLGL